MNHYRSRVRYGDVMYNFAITILQEFMTWHEA